VKLRYLTLVCDGLLKGKSTELDFVPVSDSSGRTSQRVGTHKSCDPIDVCDVIQLLACIEIHTAKEFTERFRSHIVDIERDEVIS
jgi:hypothetical protein